MNTCCNNIYPDEDLRRWENCNSTALANPENYYTKSEVDEIIEDISISGGGITSGEVQSMIDAATEPIEGSVGALSGTVGELSTDMENKAEKSEIPSLENYYNKTEVNAIADTKLDASAYTPTDLSGYATEQWVNNQGYLTQHQPLKTINNQSLIGEGNITISGGGSADLSNYWTSAQTQSAIDAATQGKADASNVYTITETDYLLNDLSQRKLDVTAYTPTDLSQYWTSAQTQSAITQKTSGYTTQQWVQNQGYLTEHQPLKTINGQSLVGEGNITISGGSADLSNYYNKQEVDDKLDLKANASDALSNVQVSPDMGLNYTQMVNRKINGNLSAAGFFRKINGKALAGWTPSDVSEMLSLVETSAITSSITSVSTDAQVPSAKATYDALSNKADASNVYTKTEVNNIVNNKFWCGTQAEYDALTTKDNEVIYLIHA